MKDKLKEFNKIDTERLEMIKKILIDKGAMEVEIKISYGIPKQKILEKSRKGYSLVLMGSQGRGFIKEIFIGGVSHYIDRSGDVSVLLVPALC